MHKYLSLSKTLIKSSVGMLTDGKNKKSMSIFLYSILFISLFPIAFVIYSMMQASFEMLGSLDQVALPMGAILLTATMIIFLFSIFLIPSIFYFSNDNLTLLTLPIKPVQIIGAKFTVCVLYEYAFAAVFLLPTYAAYVSYANPSILFYVSAILVFILVPIVPLVFSTVLTILVMRFVPFFKNRDRFNLVAGIITIISALAFSFASNSFTTMDSQEQLLNLFLQGDNSLLNILASLFPEISFFAKALCSNDILSLMIGIAITAASLVVLLTLGKYLYFKGAIGFGETSSSSKKLSEKDLRKANRKHNKLKTYALKEFKILIRTPVFFLNCVIMCFLLPILTIALPLIDDSLNIKGMIDLVSLVEKIPNFTAYVIVAGIALGFIFGSMNLVSATSISREGSHYEYMKYIPMSYGDQIHAKTLSGICLGIVTTLGTLLPIYFMFPLPLIYYLILFISSCITTVLINFIGVFLDMLHPKLIWENEAAAVKQNMAGPITMLLGFALCAILVFICINIPSDYMMMGAIILLISLILICILGWVVVARVAEKIIRNL